MDNVLENIENLMDHPKMGGMFGCSTFHDNQHSWQFGICYYSKLMKQEKKDLVVLKSKKKESLGRARGYFEDID